MDARVAVAVRDVQLTARRDREPRRSIERRAAAFDREEVRTTLGRVAAVAWLIRVAEREEQLALEGERAHRVVGVVGAVNDVFVDSDAVRAREDALAPRGEEAPVAV